MGTQQERVVCLDFIDPLSLYGVNNGKYHLLAEHFANLKLVARGNEIRATGVPENLDELEEFIAKCEDYFRRHGELPVAVMRELLSGDFQQALHSGPEQEEILVHGAKGRTIRPRTPSQIALVEALENSDLLFALGPAGTGKTYMAIALAVRALKRRELRRIVLTRPAVEAGERLGFLPGDLKEKLDPYLQPLYDGLRDMLPQQVLKGKLEDGTIQIAPLAYMRGRTLDDAFVILDEAQNATLAQMKMFLTRMGRNAKFLVTGDASQVDLPNPNQSGLRRAVDLVRDLQGVTVVEFGTRDIVRHRLVTQIVQAFESEGKTDTDNNIP
ncbi:MAG: phosphate starvation-inducible protein PhoH [Bacteroidetes bacterium]|nr:MAG: phosphate starvation-inducible protein PhoH [Bacteroidota bacterium]